MIYAADQIIQQTKKWITDVVIACNFCPFAAKEVRRNSVQYSISDKTSLTAVLQELLDQCSLLDQNAEIETSFLILPVSFQDFDEYLELIELAERLLQQHGYEGVYQVASFHPHYCFAGSSEEDAANYTNRSPYPMLHLLREESIEKALEKYSNPERIPENNIRFAQAKGEAYMKMLRDQCL